jgi:lipoteichoic acid synthase
VSAASLLVVFLAAKAAVLWDRTIAWSPWAVIAYVWQDVLVALLFGAIAWAVAAARAPSRLSTVLYWTLAVYVAINIPVGIVLSTPLTWRMLRATSGTLADSILLYATAANVIAVLFTLVMAGALRHALRGRTLNVWAAVFAGAAIVALGPTASARVDTQGLHRNPVMALVTSALPIVDSEARVDSRTWTTPPFERPGTDDLSHLRGIAAGRNVVLVSLESTGAAYLRLYGGAHDLTPNLDRLAASAVVFDHAYAIYPESIKGLFSILCSTAPAFDTAPEVYGQAPCRSIASLLGGAGYRTALFHSGRFGYLGMEAVIRHRGFDTLQDAGDIGGDHESSFGVGEPAAVAKMLSWVDALPRDQRFFLTYMPIAGHHPYETPEPGPVPSHDEIGRYRNALHYGDQALGALIDGIHARGLEHKTAWVILGDHGEALGQHEGNFGHTFFLYEENVRVPFLVAVPGVIAQPQRSRTIVSLADTAPTILDLLGEPVPPEHQGQSALAGRPRMALFFTDYSLGLVGLRDGRWKFIHELASRRSKLFDLTDDPGETRDLSRQHAPRAATYEQMLRGWTTAQKRHVTASMRRALDE